MYKRIGYGMAMAFLLCLTAGAVDFAGRSYQPAPTSTLFASGFQRFARLKNNDSLVDARYNPTAGAVGYIYSPGQWHVGAAFSYEGGTKRYSARNSTANFKVQSETPGFSIFGGIDTDSGWYTDMTAFMGFANNKAKSASFNGFSAANGTRRHDTVYAASLEAGKHYEFGFDTIVTPHFGLDYSYTPKERYTWNGIATVRNASQSYVEIPLGVSFSKVFSCGAWDIVPKVDLTLVNSLGKMDTMNNATGFAYRTANGWKVGGVGGDHLGGRITTGLTAKMSDRTSLSLDYTYEGRKRYNDHRVSALLGLSF